jgi:drug/metabolite transporter superfamily protein YnfA
LLTRPESLANLLPGTTPTPPGSNDLQELEDLRNQRDPNDLAALGANVPAAVRWLRNNWRALAIALAVAAAALIGWLIYRRRQATFFRQADLVLKLFGILGIWASRLHVRWLDSYTPLERVDAFGAKVPTAGPALTRLALLFAAQRYGRQAPQPADLASATEEWRQLQPVFWKKWAAELFDRSVTGVRKKR